MRQPTRKDKYARKILAIASKDKEEQEKAWRFVDLINEVAAENPSLPPAKQNKIVLAKAIAEGCDEFTAERLLRAAQQTLIPFLDSGAKYARADALLDDLVEKANQHLMEEVYDKDGNYITTRFSANNMNAITKALSIKMQSLTKIQSNLIMAQKESIDANAEQKEFDLEDAEREQLERFVAGELIDNADVIEMIMSRNETSNAVTVKKFYDEGEPT